MSVGTWFIDKIPLVVYFFVMVLLFGTLLYISFLAINGKERSSVAGKKNNIYYDEEAGKSSLEPKFFGRSLAAALLLGITIGIGAIIFLVLFIAAAVSMSGGDGGNPLSGYLSNSLGNTAVSLFESEARVLALVLGFLVLIFLLAGLVLKRIYSIPYGWGLLVFMLAFGLYFGLDYLIDAVAYDGGIQALINWLGRSLESWVFNMAYRNS